jgi:hypothetical protein
MNDRTSADALARLYWVRVNSLVGHIVIRAHTRFRSLRYQSESGLEIVDGGFL